MNDCDVYVQKMKAKLDEWSAENDKPLAKAEGAKADSKLEYSRQIEAIKKQGTATGIGEKTYLRRHALSRRRLTPPTRDTAS